MAAIQRCPNLTCTVPGELCVDKQLDSFLIEPSLPRSLATMHS